MSTIRFIRRNRFRREVGSLDTAMNPGVQQTLVDYGYAEYVNSGSEPSEPQSDDTSRGRKRRYHKETVSNDSSIQK